MTQLEASKLLLEFPSRWEGLRTMREQRQAILDGYKSAAAYDGSRFGQGSHSDATGRKAGKLAGLEGGHDVVLEGVRHWLTFGVTDTKDRVLLLDLWRGAKIQTIIKRRRMWDIGLRWERMTQGLVRFVGNVNGGPGVACANIHWNARTGWN